MKKFTKISIFVIMCLIISVWGIAVSALEVAVTPLDFDMDLLYGRNVLEKMENGEHLVNVYDTLLEGIQTAKTDENGYINITMDLFQLFKIDVTLEEVRLALLTVRYDNPQLFWWDHDEVTNYYHQSKGDKEIVTSVVIHSLYNTSTDEGKAAFNEVKNGFKEAADNLIKIAGIKDGMSQYEISLRLHDAVVEHVEYEAGSVNDHSAYGALIEGKSVCEGYAELYQYLLYLCGIQSHAVTGKADNNPHMWNLVKIDDEYYMSDPTWDDPVGDTLGKIRYGYFNVTTEMLRSEGRSIDNNGYDLPECTATKANHANHAYYGGRAFTDNPSLQNTITQLKYYGMARFYYTGDGSYTSADLSAWLNDNNQENLRAIANEFGIYSVNSTFSGNEIILVAQGITPQDLPIVANIPKIAAICSDTDITVKPNSIAGAVAVCPAVSGKMLTVTGIQEILNNTAVEVKELVDGKVVTGSKLVFDKEEAIIALKGDVDGDGILTVFDANIAQKSEADFSSVSELQKMASDFDESNTIDSNDAKAIVNQIVS